MDYRDIEPIDDEISHINRTGFKAVLLNPSFMLLWMGQLASQLADRLFVYVLMILAYSLTRSNLGVSVPLLSFGIPSVLLGSVAGVYVDRLNRKWIMVITSIIRGLMILMLIPLIAKSMLLIFIVSLLIYSAAQFFAPAESSSIPELVDKQNLIVANSLFMITWMGASVIGLGLGAPLTNIFGEAGTFTMAAAMYFVAAGLIFLIPKKLGKTKQRETTRQVMAELMEGVEFIRRNSIVFIALFKLFVATSALAVISLLAISYAKNILQIGEKNFGYLIISTGFGMFIGLGLLERFQRYLKHGQMVVVSFIVSGLALMLMGATKDLRMALAITFILGLGNIFLTSNLQTILQRQIPRQLRGRVFGVQNMLINSAFTFPVVLFGFFADYAGIPFSLILLGIITVVTGGIGLVLPKFKNI